MQEQNSLPIHAVTRGTTRELAVACPQRTGPVSITECVTCELCGGLHTDPARGFVGVRCDVASAGPNSGAHEVPVSAIMTQQVVCVSPDASVENVRWLFLDRRIGAAPVVNEKGKLIGIVSKSDVLRDDTLEIDAMPREAPSLEAGSSERTLSGVTVANVMTPVLLVIRDQTTIAHAAACMAENHIHHMPVIGDDGTMRGIVSALDIVRWVASTSRFA